MPASGIDAKLLFNWRRRHVQAAVSTAAEDSRGPVLLPVAVVESVTTSRRGKIQFIDERVNDSNRVVLSYEVLEALWQQRNLCRSRPSTYRGIPAPAPDMPMSSRDLVPVM